MEEEIWKPVSNYDGLYEVSNLGRVRSLNRIIVRRNGYRKTLKGTVLKKMLNSNGYECVELYNRDFVRKRKLVHCLILGSFDENKEKKPCIDHINGCRTDNRLENLRWCTQKENVNFDIARQRMLLSCSSRGKFGKDAYASKPVSQYTKDGVFIKTFASASEACRSLGLLSSGISLVCNGFRKTCGGYIWKHEETFNK